MSNCPNTAGKRSRPCLAELLEIATGLIHDDLETSKLAIHDVRHNVSLL